MADIDVKSFFEPQYFHEGQYKTFIQGYAGDFLSPREVKDASHKRCHSFSHRTYAHDFYQGRQRQPQEDCSDSDAPVAITRRTGRSATSPATHDGAFSPQGNQPSPVALGSLLSPLPFSSPSRQGNRRAARSAKDSSKYMSSCQPLVDARPGLTIREAQLAAAMLGSSADNSRNRRSDRRKTRKAQMSALSASSDSQSQDAAGYLQPPHQQSPQPQPVQSPTQQQSAILSSIPSRPSTDGGCTLVLRNIPRCVKQEDLYNLLVQFGFLDDVSLLYVPWLMGRSEQQNLGYAFVHLETLAAKQALVDAWQGKFPFGYQAGARAINIASAAIQGAVENMEAWDASKKMTRIRNPTFRPMVLKPIAGLAKNAQTV